MSKAGIQSNRGDGYQTLVAFGWALTVLSDPDYQWIEVDSVRDPVDDVVIGKTDGSKICCQCKKNQTSHKCWSIADLGDELQKAGELLATDSTAEVRFYSRSAFGELSALREYRVSYSDELSYSANLSAAHERTNAELKSRLINVKPTISAYAFLSRTMFEITPELDRMQSLLRERLHQLVCNHSAAFDALWTRLDQLGMRAHKNGPSTDIQHRLTKDNIKSLLDHAGSMSIPPLDETEVRTAFQSTSAVGRAWRRDIGGKRITSSVVSELITAIESKHRSILLTGLPGAGKTCVMLDLQEALEQRAKTCTDLLPLFIQSREFVDMVTEQDRQAQGLPDRWVEKAARMADVAHVVVVMDSLDVLSIAREHRMLTYFLAQIDRLLLIPNITVITACRDFDRRYDRRIAQRQWDQEFICQPLDWNTKIAPLLSELCIDSSATDEATRELIRNPRELALFVELAQKGGSFNVVTSQELAGRYLNTIVRDDSRLGDVAMQAIEAMAAEMLRLRSLAMPHQRFAASKDIQRTLLSNKVLIETQDGQLAFGHQTLLDVLVISGSTRRGDTLSRFIQDLTPVPFVRPSIRSFVAQLATGDRLKYRTQLRAVLTGSYAFHIRRLVAECLAEQIPQDGDWPLIRDLRIKRPDVFHVLYSRASKVEWHRFWLEQLVPVLKEQRDAKGLATHVHHVSSWIKQDSVSVLKFWMEVLQLDWLDKTELTYSMESSVPQIHEDHTELLALFLVELLKFPIQVHAIISHGIAKCIIAGVMDDALLWHYISSEVTEDDVLSDRVEEKLHCQPNRFGSSNGDFLINRMQCSSALLNFAVSAIEQWHQIKSSHCIGEKSGYACWFLDKTSYHDAHTQLTYRHADSVRILLDAVEAAIIYQAKAQSLWWKSNRERLCSSPEGALRYFAILACTAATAANLDAIGSLLCDKSLLESSLSYELGTLMQIAFVHLDPAKQDEILTTVLNLHQEAASDHVPLRWMRRKQGELIFTIPCHLRSSAAQAVLNELQWPFVRRPFITRTEGGVVESPFSIEVFIDSSDDTVLGLLAHYERYSQDFSDEFLMGGEQQVGSLLREAATRKPSCFLNRLTLHGTRIAGHFRDDIMFGVATYLARHQGQLRSNSDGPQIEEPNPATLTLQVLEELEKHPSHWLHNRAASYALKACAYLVQNRRDAERMVQLAISFTPTPEDCLTFDGTSNLLNYGINMPRGHVVQALMTLVGQLQDFHGTWPELLAPTLRQFAADKHPAVRAVLLHHLPYLQSFQPQLGWELFDLAMQENAVGLWAIAELCLYHAYHRQFDIVASWLSRLYREGNGKNLEIWGRISALTTLAGKNSFSTLLEELTLRDSVEAWHGVAMALTHPNNVRQKREECLFGLEAGLSEKNPHAAVVASNFSNIFREIEPPVDIPIEMLKRFFALLETEKSTQTSLFRFDAWLNAASSIIGPIYALEATEIYLDFFRRTKRHLYGDEGALTQLLTRLWAQAEEEEESDSGATLKRVVAAQDALLAAGAVRLDDWLRAIERP